MKFLLATRNRGKLRELEAVLAPLDVELCSLHPFSSLPDVREDGLTFAENARIKAFHYFSLTGLPTIADDSGLRVDALNGRPGIYSARIASDDESRIKAILKELDKTRQVEDRAAEFVCALCVVLERDRIIEVEGIVRGTITFRPLGEGGFGYDPIFLYPPLGKTFAQMTPEQKNQISHRAEALRQLKIQLQELSSSSDYLGEKPSREVL